MNESKYKYIATFYNSPDIDIVRVFEIDNSATRYFIHIVNSTKVYGVFSNHTRISYDKGVNQLTSSDRSIYISPIIFDSEVEMFYIKSSGDKDKLLSILTSNFNLGVNLLRNTSESFKKITFDK